MTIRIPQTADGEHLHAVRFYENDAALFRIAGGFLADGLESGLPAIAVTTSPHREGIARFLRERSLDVERLEQSGQLLLLDAHQALSGFMVDGMPDGARFRAVFTQLIRRTMRGRGDRTLRAYGEMVDVLWKDGLQVAAIRLEMLWNDLANTQNFSLLCGYSMGHFYKDGTLFDICRQHTHIVSHEGELMPHGHDVASPAIASEFAGQIDPLTRSA
jgi:hypothetical protein